MTPKKEACEERIRCLELLLAEREHSLNETIHGLEGRVRSMEEAAIENRKTNWGLLLSFMTILLALVGSGWALIGLKTDNAIGPVNVRLTEIAAKQIQFSQDTTRTDLLEAKVAAETATDAEVRNDVNELKKLSFDVRGYVELRNVQLAEQAKWNTIFYSKLFPGEPVPFSNEYYPKLP
jgi:hypothetical protein